LGTFVRPLALWDHEDPPACDIRALVLDSGRTLNGGDMMFGNKKGLISKLHEQGGVVAEATIIDAGTLYTSDSHTNSADVYAPGSTHHCEVTLKVEPEGQPPFEATFKQAFPDHIPHPGQRAKVIYDPNKRSKIAILDDTMSWGKGPVKKIMVGPDQLAKLFAGGGAATPDVADQLTKLADLRDRGVLSQPEFEAQKAKLLADR
jgi:Short C-terminal domain